MSYVQSLLSNYREDIVKDIEEILNEDSDFAIRSLKGANPLAFLVAYILIMALSLLKCVLFFFKQIRKPKYTYPYLDLSRENIREVPVQVLLEKREELKLPNTDHYYTKPKVKAKRVQSISNLRMNLYKNDCVLYAKEIKTVNHKVTGEELLECVHKNTLIKPLTSTYITFGNQINHDLKNIFGDKITLRKKKLSNETYIVIINYDYNSITDELSLIYQEEVKIKFDETRIDC